MRAVDPGTVPKSSVLWLCYVGDGLAAPDATSGEAAISPEERLAAVCAGRV